MMELNYGCQLHTAPGDVSSPCEDSHGYISSRLTDEPAHFTETAMPPQVLVIFSSSVNLYMYICHERLLWALRQC